MFLWSFIFKFRFYFKEGSVGDVIMGVECRKKSEKKKKRKEERIERKNVQLFIYFWLTFDKDDGFFVLGLYSLTI